MISGFAKSGLYNEQQYFLMDTFDKSIIIKYINAQCSEEELAELVAWTRCSDDNARELFEAQQLHIKLIGCTIPSEMEAEALSKMHEMLVNDIQTAR